MIFVRFTDHSQLFVNSSLRVSNSDFKLRFTNENVASSLQTRMHSGLVVSESDSLRFRN